jgi:predicted AAA+ superfamily ATPase
MELPHGQSAFLWGPRKSGKSTYLKQRFPHSVRYNLLKTDLYWQLSKDPHIFREQIQALSAQELQHPIIVDEVQKIPQLLDEIHLLIEETKASFILCGSSARKLKYGAANLLGGRAWSYNFYPLVYEEIPDFNLLHALKNGLIPSHYLAQDAHRFLKAYVLTYLSEEIKAEGLVRNLPAFAKFLDSLAFSHGELTNYSNIARDCGVDSKTVHQYYQILIDTLMGYNILPFSKRVSREIVSAAPKFYLFDVGLANYICQRKILELKSSDAGRAFEHYILMELIAYRGLKDKQFEINFWRTKTGLEVDFVLAHGAIAIEVKISKKVDRKELNGVMAFQEEHAPEKAYVVCLEDRARKIINGTKEIIILPWEKFLKMLWHGEIV